MYAQIDVICNTYIHPFPYRRILVFVCVEYHCNVNSYYNSVPYSVPFLSLSLPRNNTILPRSINKTLQKATHSAHILHLY